jgi:hypothetical protein
MAETLSDRLARAVQANRESVPDKCRDRTGLLNEHAVVHFHSSMFDACARAAKH